MCQCCSGKIWFDFFSFIIIVLIDKKDRREVYEWTNEQTNKNKQNPRSKRRGEREKKILQTISDWNPGMGTWITLRWIFYKNIIGLPKIDLWKNAINATILRHSRKRKSPYVEELHMHLFMHRFCQCPVLIVTG